MRNIFLLLICLLLSACAASNQQQVVKPSKPEAKTKTSLNYPQLRQELAKLPGAMISDREPLLVTYPAGSLFAQNAVLPMPGGTGSLDALARLIKHSNLTWQLKIRAYAGEGADYDEQLAAERAKILRTYLRGAGVNVKKIMIMTVAEEGAPLELSVSQ